MKERNYIVFLKEGGVIKTVQNFADPAHSGKMTTILNATGFEYSNKKPFVSTKSKCTKQPHTDQTAAVNCDNDCISSCHLLPLLTICILCCPYHEFSHDSLMLGILCHIQQVHKEKVVTTTRV